LPSDATSQYPYDAPIAISSLTFDLEVYDLKLSLDHRAVARDVVANADG
jgi:hypothetical protein